MKHLPLLLIYARLLLGLLILAFSLIQLPAFRVVSVTLLTVGLLTDVFDGIIARRLRISTARLRRLDSTVDQVFFCSCALAAYFNSPAFFHSNASWLLVLLGLEGLTYVVCFLKFRKEVATHSLGAKLWTLTLFATLLELLLHGQSTTLFVICLGVGVLTRLEIIAILLILKHWAHDVPTVYHSVRLRQQKSIKRHRLFNG